MNITAPSQNLTAEQPLSPWQMFRRRLKQRRIAMVGGVILIGLYFVALVAGFAAPYHFERQDRDRFFHPPTWPQLSGFRLVVPRYEQLPGSFNYRAVTGDSKPIHFFVRGDKYKWSVKLSAINVANDYVLYNFLSTFSGTHYVTPRTLSAQLGFHF